ncbi:MAG: hypothetical protein VX874_15705 [Pseudomonadota bacterium]|nr:hypothetical protein [Pseudomonadota bacterium]
MIWFAEQFTPSGRVAPVLFHGDKPSLVTPDGPRRLLQSRVVRISEADEGKALDRLQQIYGHPNSRRVARSIPR